MGAQLSDQVPGGSAADPLLMDVTEAAAKLRLSKMTVYRRLRSGEWPGGRCGRKWLMPRAFVLGLVAEISSGRNVIAEQYAASAWPEAAA